MNPEEYRLKIADLDCATLPMARLAEYITDLASLLGYRESVHFARVEAGSTEIVAIIDHRDAPKVRERLQAARDADAPPELQNAFKRLDRRLRSDNTSADLTASGRKIVEFPGARVPANLQFGPFNEAGSLVGVPIRIGGKNDPVPVHLRDTDGTIHECLARLDLAARLAKHMFETPVRAEGVGRWRREASGEWLLEKFTIKDFEPLSKEKLSETIARLRENPPGWVDEDDPLGMLKELRTG